MRVVSPWLWFQSVWACNDIATNILASDWFWSWTVYLNTSYLEPTYLLHLLTDYVSNLSSWWRTLKIITSQLKFSHLWTVDKAFYIIYIFIYNVAIKYVRGFALLFIVCNMQYVVFIVPSRMWHANSSSSFARTNSTCASVWNAIKRYFNTVYFFHSS